MNYRDRLRICLVCIGINFITCVLGQKPPIDTSAFSRWPRISNPVISNNGQYAIHTLSNQRVKSYTVVIQAINGNWKLEIPKAYRALITEDSRRVILMKAKDSLGIVMLGNSNIEYISGVRSFQVPAKSGGQWVAYQSNDPQKGVNLLNLETGIIQTFSDVTNYLLSDDGNTFLIQTQNKKDAAGNSKLHIIQLNTGDSAVIWEGPKASNFIFDSENEQLAFLSARKIDSSEVNCLWHYKVGQRSILLISDSTCINDYGLIIDRNSALSFSKDRKRIYFYLKDKSSSKSSKGLTKVDVWSHSDAKIQSKQLFEIGNRSYLSTVGIENHTVARLEQEDDQILNHQNRCDYVLMATRSGDGNEWYWNDNAQTSVCLVSVRDGSRKVIKTEIPYPTRTSYQLSPNGEYVVYYDPKEKNYFSYSISGGISRNITSKIVTKWAKLEESDTPQGYCIPEGIAGWLNGDSAVLLYDQYDLWLVYLKSNKLPVNITNQYSKKHDIAFRLAFDYFGKALSSNEKVLLTAFNRSNKNNGFFITQLDRKDDPEMLTMGPYIYYVPNYFLGTRVTKALNAETYLVRRMRANESINYLSTSDFRNFEPLSTSSPEKQYNWLTTELVTWQTLDGSVSQGVLYKPENFDSTKQYPLIILFYEKRSETLNGFLSPEYSYGEINIPWFVSNGYLVFIPDIYYRTGYPGQSAFNSVVSGANYLAKKSWVNARKMGIQGHSFGGYEVNFLITRTNIFAAAAAGAGVSDLVGANGALDFTGSSRHHIYEMAQSRIGFSLWQKPNLYLENSPIFRADKVHTPLLLNNNKGDKQVPFLQGVEFFTALRRLGKKVWMLQYDEGGHALNGNDAYDFTIRITQYFDHYLKGMPPPKWMTVGIPARLKGIETGYELDPNGSCGKDCKVCKKWNAQYKKTPEMFTKPISEWHLDVKTNK